ALRLRDLHAREQALVVLEHVPIDRRYHVVRVLHVAADGLGFLGQVVERHHDVRLVALVVVQHRVDGPRGGGAVLLDREAVETTGERSGDRVRRHAVGEATFVGSDDSLASAGSALAHARDSSIGRNALSVRSICSGARLGRRNTSGMSVPAACHWARRSRASAGAPNAVSSSSRLSAAAGTSPVNFGLLAPITASISRPNPWRASERRESGPTRGK